MINDAILHNPYSIAGTSCGVVMLCEVVLRMTCDVMVALLETTLDITI